MHIKATILAKFTSANYSLKSRTSQNVVPMKYSLQVLFSKKE